MARSRIAGDDLTGVDPDPHLQPGVGAELGLEHGYLLPKLERRANSAQRVVLAHRRDAEDGHHLVADEVLDRAAVALDRAGCQLEKARHHLAQRLGVEPPGKLGIGDHVAKQDGNRLARLDRDVGRERRTARPAVVVAVRVRCATPSADTCGLRGPQPRDGRGRRRGRGRRQVKRGILMEDRLLELLQRLAWVETELVDKRCPCVLVGGERVGLAAGAVEGQDQQPAQILAKRMLAHERFQLAHRLGVTAECQVGLQALLERDQAQLLETADLVAGKRLVLEISKRRAAPERERFAEHETRLLRGASCQQSAALFEQALEPLNVKGPRFDAEHVSGRPRLQDGLAEHLAQV